MSSRLIGALLLSAAVVACAREEAAPPPAASAEAAAPSAEEVAAESERLNQWFDAKYEEQLAFSPIQKTFLGRKDDYDKIDDLSEAGEDAQLAWRRASVAELKASFDYAKLTPEAKTSYDMWVYELERAEQALPFRRRQYVFTQMQGPHAFLAQFLIAFHRVDEAADLDAYVARIGETARALDQLLDRAKAHAAEGVRPPRFSYETVIAEARRLASGAPLAGEGENPVYADVKSEIAALKAAGKIDDAKGAEILAAAEQALVSKFGPSYAALADWMEQDLPNVSAAPAGVGALPDGAAFYNERLAASTTTAMTADEIHALGLAEVARIHQEMEVIKEKVGFAGTLQEFFAFTRTDPQFFFPDTDEGRQAYIDAATAYLDAIDAKLPDYFGLLPKADLVVRRVEAFREQPGAAQHYFPGTPDGSRPGVYYAHLSDMKAMPKTVLEVIAYHEGNPGHHMQISIAQELTGVPQFRTQAGVTAYSEGWGLYSELLAKEMGAYEDPYSDFGRLGSEIWRAVRLVVDTGIHAKGWSEEEAFAYMAANAPVAEGAVRSEIRRYFVIPGQATAYKVGMLKILELREKARAELGDAFDIRAFHDTVLGGGALPLPILERRVEEWIAAEKAA